MHSIIHGGLNPGGRSLKRDRRSVFFTAVNPMYANQDLEEVRYDLDKPRIAVHNNTWRIHQRTVYWCNLKLVLRKGQFCQTRSHAIALFNILPSTYIEKVVFIEDWRGFILQNIPIPKVTAESYSRRICIMDRHDLSNTVARTSANHQSERKRKERGNSRSHLEDTRRKHLEENQRAKYKETCCGNVELLNSRYTQQFETHPNRDSSMEDLNKTEEFNPFSEKSKEFITSTGHTEYFELCEMSSKIQCPDGS